MERSEQLGDETLAILYRTITKTGGELSLSLLVGGSWLSGIAIGGRAWWNQMAETVRQSPRGGGFDEAFAILGQRIYPSDAEVEAGVVEPVDEDRPVTYIHLRDAWICGENVRIPAKGMLVRCRIDAVAAWLLAQLGPEGYVPPKPIV